MFFSTAVVLQGRPVPLEVCDKGRAEMAIGLLAAVEGHILAELIARLLSHPDGLAVCSRADHPSPGDLGHGPFYGFIHLSRRNHLIHNPASLWREDGERRIEQNPCWVILSPTNRENRIGATPGDDPFFACGEVEVGTFFRNYIIDHEKNLAAAADGECFQGRDPGFFQGEPRRLQGRKPRRPTPGKACLRIPVLSSCRTSAIISRGKGGLD